jgi:hypothetical protein
MYTVYQYKLANEDRINVYFHTVNGKETISHILFNKKKINMDELKEIPIIVNSGGHELHKSYMYEKVSNRKLSPTAQATITQLSETLNNSCKFTPRKTLAQASASPSASSKPSSSKPASSTPLS